MGKEVGMEGVVRKEKTGVNGKLTSRAKVREGSYGDRDKSYK